MMKNIVNVEFDNNDIIEVDVSGFVCGGGI